ncbi:hypothetical protein RCC30_23080 [Pseudomonas fluorescens]|nr:hypothetical protein RCC30_23080 [Pseudomonas fluorescens]
MADGKLSHEYQGFDCFQGVAAPGTAVTVVDYSDNSDVWSETLIVPDAAIAWELPSLKKLLRSGNYAVVAKLNYPLAADLYSPPVSFDFWGYRRLLTRILPMPGINLLPWKAVTVLSVQG